MCVLSVCMYVCVLFCASVHRLYYLHRLGTGWLTVHKFQFSSLQFTRSRSRFIFEGSEPEPPEIGRLRNSALYFSYLGRSRSRTINSWLRLQANRAAPTAPAPEHCLKVSRLGFVRNNSKRWRMDTFGLIYR